MTDQQGQLETHVHPARLVLFVVLSAGFVLWIGFGQIQARVWVEGQLNLLDRRISAMWSYFGGNLPELPAPDLISSLFWLSLAFIVVGTVAGLWLILCTPDDDPHDESWEVIHAAHLIDEPV